jgi:hypothetical protein
MTDREALAALTAALDAYFVGRHSPAWMQAFNALLAALAEARRVLDK